MSAHQTSTPTRTWDPPAIVANKPVNNPVCYTAGLAVLVLNRLRYALLGYRNARPFSVSEIERAIAYDLNVVDQWLHWLDIYSHGQASIAGKNILELGPGADLGIGLALLSRCAGSYNALDVNDLVSHVPAEFYAALFARLAQEGVPGATLEQLQSQLAQTQAGNNDRLNYVVNDDFDIGIFAQCGIDLVVSQAAFEHFDDIGATLRLLSQHVRPGCVLVAEVDLSTHTRWFRDHDPLNIYRYGTPLYEALRFRGAPNRVPASEYSRILHEAGWENIVATPLRVVSDPYFDSTAGALPASHRELGPEAGYLSICLCATKS